MPSKIYNIYKPLGLTPLQALEKFKKKKKLSKNLSITYAGRLDPMAEGVLLLLTGDKVHEKEKYLKLDKTYRAQILFGVSTDTFDILGKILNIGGAVPKIDTINKEIKNFTGKITLPIPPYSSVPISGKPSFMHARAGDLKLDNAQKREMEIYKVKFNAYKKISPDKVLKTVQHKIAKVSGDFRQKEVLKLWKQNLTSSKSLQFGLLDITISCRSGTYIRSIAHTLGKNLSTPSLLYNLKREKVGKYTISKSLKV